MKDPVGPVKSFKTIKELSKKHKVPIEVIKKQVEIGTKVELEHTSDRSSARITALQHIDEIPNYYDKLKKIEKTSKKKMTKESKIYEDHKEINSGKKKDEEGYMANIELDKMEKSIEILRRIIKKPDHQLPAWVQSKITRAADFIDTAAEYLSSDEEVMESKKPGLWANIRAKRKRGERPARPGEKGYPKTLDIEEGMKQARKNVGASKCWSGYTARGTKIKDGKEVPDCQKEDVTIEDANGNKYVEFIDIIKPEPLKPTKSNWRKELEEAKKSEMPCNKPKAEAHGSGETGKSHVVKACENGKEKLIRFGQLGVKGSPKKKGESEEYASRRHRFKSRHEKNIAKGKMSAAYWANKVKW
jgi:ribosomal protein L7Ae-like RNA K-turn-binding protein